MTHDTSNRARLPQSGCSDWSRIWLLLLAGVECALQIGKVPGALGSPSPLMLAPAAALGLTLGWSMRSR